MAPQKHNLSAKSTFKIEGMTCAACARHVENSLKKIPGVISASVNIATEKASVEWDPARIKPREIVQVVVDAGYGVMGGETAVVPEGLESEDEDSLEGPKREDDDDRRVRLSAKRMVSAWIFTAPLVILMVPHMFFGIMWPPSHVFNVLQVILAAPVVFYVGRPTLMGAARAVRHGTTNMDVLIALGTLSAFITGLAGFIWPVENYAGVAAMITAFHLTGRHIETKAKGRASQAIKRLLSLEAETAVILEGNQEKEVPLEKVKVGDIMVVRPGGKIPTDGMVVEGETAVDESMATGESMPVLKVPGSEVIGSTINQYGVIKVKATRIGSDTFLARVIKLVEEAQGTKVPIQEFADRVTSYFVPVVLALALGTFLVWLLAPETMRSIARWGHTFLPWVKPDLSTVTLAVFASVSVLVIACPCALGLATPTALMVGSGMGAENGILIRSGEAIQTLRDLDVIVFDKTGTITKGKPEVTDVIPAPGVSTEDLLFAAASAEKGSEHPIGRAIVREAEHRNVRVQDAESFEALAGRGVKAMIQGREVLVGSQRLFEERGLEMDRDLLSRAEEEGKTVMMVSSGGTFMGVIAVADPIKEDSAWAIRELKRMGIKTVMITGDNKKTAEAIARKVGIDRVLAEVLPEGKVDEIRRLQEEEGMVAMVGDGINDAPALTQANVGIAIGTGTDIAIESSDVTLVRGSLSEVVTALNLSKATFAKIRQNLFWAFFYNLIAIPVAMAGLLHPVIAEIAMAISSVTVVTNANLLRHRRIRPDLKWVGSP
ncbi:MAG TPA: copper-translocating P-type ATPase [Clostridia bacterium]|nr:copper-translocating P-type ATPase [Clostridia bacterium]